MDRGLNKLDVFRALQGNIEHLLAKTDVSTLPRETPDQLATIVRLTLLPGRVYSCERAIQYAINELVTEYDAVVAQLNEGAD
jgi:hypothetical protein